MCPQLVPRVALMAVPKPGPTKKKASIKALAATRHLSQADAASATNPTIAIHIHEARRIEPNIQKCDQIQPLPAIPAFKKKRRSVGIQVMTDTRLAITRNFPRTYSVREIGRPRISGKALFAKSIATNCGPCHVISRNEIHDCIPRKARKK